MTPARPIPAAIAAVLLLAACKQQPPAPGPATPAAPATVAGPAAPAAASAAPVPAAPEPVAEDWALPGAFDPTDTRETLEQRFGKANVKAATLAAAEGEQVPGLIVFDEDPERRLEIGLESDAPDARISAVTVRERRTRWSMRGLRPGDALATLVAANGAPLSFYGFSWDYGGSVADWLGGKLANPVGAPAFHRIVLEPASEQDAESLPMGDASFRSDDPKWPGLGTRVAIGQISVSWPEAND